MKVTWVAYLDTRKRWEAFLDTSLEGAVKLKVTELPATTVDRQRLPMRLPLEVRVTLGPASATLNACTEDRELSFALAERLATVVLTPEFRAQVHKACMETA